MAFWVSLGPVAQSSETTCHSLRLFILGMILEMSLILLEQFVLANNGRLPSAGMNVSSLPSM